MNHISDLNLRHREKHPASSLVTVAMAVNKDYNENKSSRQSTETVLITS